MENNKPKKANTPLEQIYYNTKDIEKLKEIVKPLYNCNANLGDSATNVLRENTNYPEGAEFGFLIDYNGHLYKINGTNTDQTQLYIEFYATLKGADGASAIDDDVVSTFKCWSSDKTLGEINKARDKGIYITSTQPTFNDPFYTLSTANLNNINSNIAIQVNDLIIYTDAEEKVKELYKIVMMGETTLDLLKIGDFGGEEAKQLYQHNISFNTLINGGNDGTLYGTIQITNNSAQEMTFANVIAYLAENDFSSEFYQLPVNIIWKNSNNHYYAILGLYKTTTELKGMAKIDNNLYPTDLDFTLFVNATFGTYHDKVQEL